MRRPLAALALALLLVTAGCNTTGGGPGTATGSATPAPVPSDSPTATPERVVPGLTLNGVVDAERLVRAHETALIGERYVYQFDGARRANNTTVAGYSGSFTAGPDCGSYTYRAYRDRPAPSRLTQWYANGSVALSRSFDVNLSTVDPDDLLVEPRPEPVTRDGAPADPCAVRPLDPRRSDVLAALYGNLSFTVRERFDGYVLLATNGSVPVLDVADPGGAPVTDVTVRTARVQLTDEGRVVSVSVSFAGRSGEGRVEGSHSFRVYEGDDVAATPPWPANATATASEG
ncbi:hypothetical protein [Halosegnis marinus]|uniref:Lipoprotein n=1 Tax=Halosegnis marinus TaxID=3034023 RepID=A0ABD5ZKT2_9EURY|nr:hypothetical protein [Halosegnis sp. DT85]